MPKLTREALHKMREDAKKGVYLREGNFRGKIIVHMGTCGIAAGARDVLAALMDALQKSGLTDIAITTSGCAGLCSMEPMATVQISDAAPVKYGKLNADKARKVFETHVVGGQILAEYALGALPFFEKQMLVVLRNMGIIDPEKIEDYLARDGYVALETVVCSLTPEEVVDRISRAGLRGRGGAGFPTGVKWKVCRAEKKTPKFIIGNCDEGDPGAYMDRSLLESDPHSVVEGLTIAAYAIGAAKGYVYIRTEYPLAIERMRKAILQANEYGLLGENILDSGFSFDLEIREGSGAFVCGEETSLIHSIEGAVPEPRQRPPFPAQSGLWGFPTVIDNVETLANVPVIISRGVDWYTQIGTESSKGTKIFSLVGKINNTGLIEVPMGITLREVIYEVGGGIPDGKRLKAVQTGGPSGGCIPAQLMDLPIDYESLKSAGSMMGSGGMIVMDEDTCAVDVSKFFLQFTNDESCGKCSACREGSAALLEVLTRIADGEGRDGDLEYLEELAHGVKDASMCGLGQTLPNPVLSTLRYFRDEYEAHLKYKRCPAVVCRGIISSPCQYLCPLGTDIPSYLTAIAKGQFSEALDIIRKTNPLPIVCGRVCIAHCETKCRAGEGGGPLAIRELKRFLSDWELQSGEIPDVSPFPRVYAEKVAIIGSGPSGLTAAYCLAQKGYDATVFEALPVAGGMLAVGIPDYRLPQKLLDIELEAIQKAGVTIKTNSSVCDINALLSEGYKAVLIAVGAHKGRKLGVPGEDAAGIMDPLTFLQKVNLGEAVPALGERVGVVGGGDTALDAARTALRLGAKEVTILYRRTRVEMPAGELEVQAALDEGIKIEFLVAPTRVISENGKLEAVEFIRTKLGDADESGRRRPVRIEGSEFTLTLDTLMPAISQDPDLAFIPAGSGIETIQGLVAADRETYMTTKAGVFACGDAVTGPADVTTCMASAKIAAEYIHKYLRGEPLTRTYRPVTPSVVVEPIAVTEEDTATLSRAQMPTLSPEQRRQGFEEVELGFTEAMAVREAQRCLRCDWEVQRRKRQEARERAPSAAAH